MIVIYRQEGNRIRLKAVPAKAGPVGPRGQKTKPVKDTYDLYPIDADEDTEPLVLGVPLSENPVDGCCMKAKGNAPLPEEEDGEEDEADGPLVSPEEAERLRKNAEDRRLTDLAAAKLITPGRVPDTIPAKGSPKPGEPDNPVPERAGRK